MRHFASPEPLGPLGKSLHLRASPVGANLLSLKVAPNCLFKSKKGIPKKEFNRQVGATFKENCPDIRNTKIFDLYRSLGDLNMIADVFDPIADNGEIKQTYGITSLLDKPPQKYDAVILAVPHNYFLEMGLIEIKKFCSEDNLFFDLKSVYQPSESTFRL